MLQVSPKKTAGPLAVLKIYVRHMLYQPMLVTWAFVGLCLIQVGTLIAPLYLRDLINLLARNEPATEIVTQAITLVGFIAFWWGIRWFGERLEHFLNLRVIANAMASLTAEAFEYLIDHSYHFFTSNFSGSLTHKVNKFARSFLTLFEGLALNVLPTIMFIVAAVAILYAHNSIIGISLGIWVVIFFAFQIWVTNLRQPLRKKRSAADTKITAMLADTISNQPTISQFSGAVFERKRFGETIEDWRKAGLKSWNADAVVWAGLGTLMMIIEIGLIYGAIVLWGNGLLTVGDFVLIQAYLLTLFERLVSIQRELRRVYDAFADAGEMVDILEQPHEVSDIPGAKKLKTIGAEIQFRDVNFYFNQTRDVLKDFNLHIPGSEKVALVGPSGAGKTTITKLLLRLYDVNSGSIEIDGQNIAHVKQDSLRESIAFVPQEPILFHRTLMENIRYGRREATDEEVIEAAKKAHCHEFITSLPERYNTYVGERGVKLSGGERQRVAIARAILKDAPILILDEATSSLDSESEALIQDALATLMEGKTVVVIAHRLSTIMRMDRILVLDGGKIVAEGTHQKLLAQDGLYQKLWNIQAGGFIGEDEDMTRNNEE